MKLQLHFHSTFLSVFSLPGDDLSFEYNYRLHANKFLPLASKSLLSKDIIRLATGGYRCACCDVTLKSTYEVTMHVQSADHLSKQKQHAPEIVHERRDGQ